MGWLEILGMVILGATAVAAVISLALVTYDTIKEWVNEKKNKHPDARTVEVIKEKLSNGKYVVICGVFGAQGKQLETQKWEAKELDSKLKEKFGQKNKIVLDLNEV
ncbi:MAG: hypothetical protein LBB43_05100 [Spirochaetaceae bacterium]|jgi:hypothetical protein|nr:hypothetical protein [Spirochaetaceae bacterium]